MFTPTKSALPTAPFPTRIPYAESEAEMSVKVEVVDPAISNAASLAEDTEMLSKDAAANLPPIETPVSPPEIVPWLNEGVTRFTDVVS